MKAGSEPQFLTLFLRDCRDPGESSEQLDLKSFCAQARYLKALDPSQERLQGALEALRVSGSALGGPGRALGGLGEAWDGLGELWDNPERLNMSNQTPDQPH